MSLKLISGLAVTAVLVACATPMPRGKPANEEIDEEKDDHDLDQSGPEFDVAGNVGSAEFEFLIGGFQEGSSGDFSGLPEQCLVHLTGGHLGGGVVNVPGGNSASSVSRDGVSIRMIS